MKRCSWPKHDLMIAYHDTEWGEPSHDDRKHYEFLVLESAQSGLSWDTVLRKRENYRKAFVNFDYKKVAKFTEADIERMMGDAGLIRNRQKLTAAVNNAQRLLEIQKEFGSFSAYIWGFVGGKPLQHNCKTTADIPATSPESDALAKDMKKRGFKFVGSTVLYSHMQATGLINDHTTDCFRYKELK